MTTYEEKALEEMAAWQQKMKHAPLLFGGMPKKIQNKINRMIPEKVHEAITTAMKQMTRAVIFGSGYITAGPLTDATLEERETKVKQRIKIYKNTAATEGAITGAGGILLGLADFPLWLTLKMKMLHEIAALYGHNVKEYKERIYLLYIFQLTFSSRGQRRKVVELMEDWSQQEHNLPENINEFDWRTFQLEYRDYIDLAKLLQLVPLIGAPVGAYVNHRLTQKLGTAAMNAFRMRWKSQKMLA
ncbi:MAG TPA: EcsC family protein [Chryseolinea sp.]